MIIRDFDRQDILSPQEVAETVKKLPKAHLKGLQSILFKPAAEFQALQLEVSPGCKGAFYPEYRSIVIFDLIDQSMANHIILHEIGHYVYHRYLDSYIKKYWATEIWPKSKKVTAYGETNPVEGFAETYAIYAADSSKLASFAKKYNFMRAKVFKN